MKSHELMKPTERTFFLGGDVHGEVLRWMYPKMTYQKQGAMVVVHIEDESGMCSAVLEPATLATLVDVVFYRHHRDCKTDQRMQTKKAVQTYRDTLVRDDR